MQVRVRFAPSPTGTLHIGSVRTALFNWLYAKHCKGTFILRIEDTDRERSDQAHVESIIKAMNWLGLNYDEGPFYQSQRMPAYQAAIEELLKKDLAYPCYCSEERLEQMRAQQTANKQKPRYDGHCRNLATKPKDQPHVIRFKNPLEGDVVVDDQVYGKVVFSNQELDDLIIARSDGSPTYNFTVVVDDRDMKITHVIRGDDHLNNTPKQINLLTALGAPLPVYAHLPMLHDEQGKKLSKRHGAADVINYREQGYLPHAVINYLARLGWSHGDQEIFSMQEMIDFFDLSHIHKSAAAINPEKLAWLNQHYLKTADSNSFIEEIKYQFQKQNLDWKNGPDVKELIAAQAQRCKTLAEVVEASKYFYQNEIDYAPEAVDKFILTAQKDMFEYLLNAFKNLTIWEKPQLHGIIEQTCKDLNVKMGQVGQPLRVALTGNTQSPSLDITLFLLGKSKTLQRLEHVVKTYFK